MAGRRGNGEGSVYQRKDGLWVGEISLGTNDKTGKRTRKPFYGKTKKEVTDKLALARRDRDQGLPVAVKKQSYEQFLETWLDDCVKPSVRITTYENYRKLTRCHLMADLGRVQLARLQPQQLQHFLNNKSEAGLSTRTVQYLHRLLCMSLDVAHKWGMVPRNVALLVEPPKLKKREMLFFTPEQARVFVTAIKGDKLEALYMLTLVLGLRRGEVLALKWEDIDFDARTVTVKASMQRAQGKLQRLEVKTDKSNRCVVLPAMAVSALRAQLIRQDWDKRVAGDRWQDQGYIFTTGIGTPIEPRNLDRAFAALLARSQLPHIRFHDLRHSAATLMMARGISAKTVSEILGHSTVHMTLNVYSHVLDPMKQDAADRMDGLLGGTG